MITPALATGVSIGALILGFLAGYLTRDKRIFGEVATEIREEAGDAAVTARKVEKSVNRKIERMESKVDGVRDDLSDLIRTAASQVDPEEDRSSPPDGPTGTRIK